MFGMLADWDLCMKSRGAPSSVRFVTRECNDSGHLMPGMLRPLLGRRKCVRRTPRKIGPPSPGVGFSAGQNCRPSRILSTASAWHAQCRPRRHFLMAPG
eukprot:3114173-Pyramimonas_sp.AAC.1